MTYGVLTLATANDYRKAIGLALSLRVSNPGVPVAVACSPRVRPLVAPYFDRVIDEKPGLRGFVHKVHLDQYSPFDDTFFFDSDVLVFRNLSPIVAAWHDRPYNACGRYDTQGVLGSGFDRVKVLRIIGRARLAVIDGAGHAYFRKPACSQVFELARKVSANYAQYTGGPVRYADEEVLSIVMTLLDIAPREYGDFFSRYLTAGPGTLDIDAAAGHCELVERADGRQYRPYMMHFAANEGPFTYARELRRLFRKFGLDTSGLLSGAVADYYETEIRWPVTSFVKRLLNARAARQPGA
jgi:hypothetical protein